MGKKFQVFIILAIIILSTIVLFISTNILTTKTSEVTQRIYNATFNDIKNSTDLLIKNKKESTLSIALALSRDKFLIEALEYNDYKRLELDNLSVSLSKFTRFKNVWFQIVDKNGISFYRSWTEKRGDNISNSRLDLLDIIENKKITSSVSVGMFDMTFKSMVPIFGTQNEFLGIFEIITHFNSISRNLREKGYEAVVLTDKKYKKQLTDTFTKSFIGDYYIANIDANKKLVEMIQKDSVEYYIKREEKFVIDMQNGYFFTLYKIPDIHQQDMGYLLIFKKLDDFKMAELKNTKQNIVFIMFIIIITIVISGYYIFNYQYNKVLSQNLFHTQKEKDKINAILSAQPYIIILVYENSSEDVNAQFFKFFNQYETLEAFKKEHKCICDFFIKPQKSDDSYLYDVENWIKVILDNPSIEYKVAMMKHNEERHFIVKAVKLNEINTKDGFIVLTFIDITDTKQKDELLYEQSKHASMGEMIGNIAHQWRQPLSVISAGVTGMQMQKEYGTLSDEMFEKTCVSINDNAQYLSKTIDDFRNFIKGDTKKEFFNFKNHTEKFIHLIESVSKSHEINLVLDVDKNLELNGYPSELLQCFINIFNNAKDALDINKIEKKYIFLSIQKEFENVVIEFKDNGGGIKDDILPNIFEPYFTTKHKSQGTGLGLHMTYKLITENMKGSIVATNVEYEYKTEHFKGALFTITLPLS